MSDTRTPIGPLSAEREAMIRENLLTGENATPSCLACNEHLLLAEVDYQRAEVARLESELAEGEQAFQAGLRRRMTIERERDDALMLLASCQEERAAFRGQRDEALQTLAHFAGVEP